MEKSRCKVVDIINCTTQKRSGRRGQQNNGSSHFHIMAHYAFFESSPKRPDSKFNLTYVFLQGTRDDAKDPIVRAFHTWATKLLISRLVFTTVVIETGSFGQPLQSASSCISFANGRLHFNLNQTWGASASKGVYDLETIALHEIGLLLGLGHSSVEDAFMYATLPIGVTKGFHGDDIFKALNIYMTFE
ncbi:Metalloendoproteinase 2-MMP-like [Melia azedarach]|uniref:Metalloendoproteinase 2-MMP-like n=1 Tax=Melia azedarach TaxID=155640 RepID=A0ACC1WUG0_MELAZ|nr:Metalloendoproteinase 2-MMP-like [Melia azedarach]